MNFLHLLLPFLLAANAHAREVKVDGRLSCTSATTGDQIPISVMAKTTATLWEEDTWPDPDDLVDTSNVWRGKFHLQGEEREHTWERYYVQFELPCAWQHNCVDAAYSKMCEGPEADRRSKMATFSYQFETVPGLAADNVEKYYDLDCSIGFKSADGKVWEGLSCTGGRCNNKERCSLEIGKRRRRTIIKQ